MVVEGRKGGRGGGVEPRRIGKGGVVDIAEDLVGLGHCVVAERLKQARMGDGWMDVDSRREQGGGRRWYYSRTGRAAARVGLAAKLNLPICF